MKLARLRHILAVFAKYGFEDLLVRSGIAKFLPGYRQPSKKTRKEQRKYQAKNFRLALEELGPTFIKLGQFLSSRSDLFPVEYLNELEKLQDQVPPFSGQEALETVAAELGRPLEQIFAAVSPKVEASASLAQIHQATLKDGDEVVLKIQRPDLRRVISLDINILYSLAGLLDKHSTWAKYYNFTKFVQEFERIMLNELDFAKEGHNIERLAENLKYFDHLHLPKVYWSYSTGKVLTLEHIRGHRLGSVELVMPAVNRRRLAEEILDAYLKQIVEDGFFHADPHLGNLLIEADGRISLIDLGIVGHLDADMRFRIGQLLLSFANQEAEKLTDIMLEIGEPVGATDAKALEQDIHAIVTKYHFVTAAELGVGRAILDLAKAAVEHRLRLPQNFSMLGKTLLYIDVVIKELCPDLDYMDFVKRSTQQVFFNIWRSQYAAANLGATVLEANRLMLDAPGRFNLLFEKLLRDEITIRFEHEHLGGMLKTLHQGANRLSFAMVVGAIIVGSALIIRLNVGQAFFGYSMLGLFGFIIAALLGIYLLIRILKTERL